MKKNIISESGEAIYVDMTEEEIDEFAPTREEQLMAELSDLHMRLRDLDYIGVKIATGRGTREEYHEEIQLMNQYANRVNEIEEELGYEDRS